MEVASQRWMLRSCRNIFQFLYWTDTRIWSSSGS